MKIASGFNVLNVACLVVMASFCHSAVADQLYKWVDSQGRVTYQSTPPPDDAAEVVKTTIGTVGAEEGDAPAEQVFETDPIKFYTKPDCATCNLARTYFEEMEIPFEEVNIAEDEALAAKMQKNFGHNNVPTIKVGNKSVTGYEVNTMAKILKDAGYNIPGEEEGAPAEALVPAEEEAPAESTEQAEPATQ